jgi:hypothetical protein
MIVQFGEPSFGSAEARFKTCVFNVARWRCLVIPDLCEHEHRRSSRFRNTGSKSFGFSFCLCDRRTHNSSNERESTCIGLPVSLRRAKSELAEVKHRILPSSAAPAP